MANIDLSKYGITGVTEILYNPTYEVLYNEETKPGLEGFEKGQVTELGAINVMTGVYTGRSPKDKYIVMDANSKDTVWWTSEEYKNDNHPLSEENWAILKSLAQKQLSGKRLFVVDGFCGTHKDTRMKVRFIMEVAWQAHFVTNMFIRPQNQAEFDQEPDFVVYCAAKAKVENYKEMGLNSETAVAFNVTSKEQVILNTWYGGEMKKGMFSMQNYFLPLKGIASMHCSANTDLNGENTAIFFGLSGTGKTTLSTDPKRLLIGDDEHGWDDHGVFNLEGGCYAKVINLDKESITEPTPTFSACFGQAFLELHPTKYAEELVKKMEKSGAKAYLVNTGWNGTGKRISIRDTRGIIDAILNGSIETAPTKVIPHFNFEVPTELPGVDSHILDPRDTYADASVWEEKAKDLAGRFVKNFKKYENNEAGKALVAAGPVVE